MDQGREGGCLSTQGVVLVEDRHPVVGRHLVEGRHFEEDVHYVVDRHLLEEDMHQLGLEVQIVVGDNQTLVLCLTKSLGADCIKDFLIYLDVLVHEQLLYEFSSLPGSSRASSSSR